MKLADLFEGVDLVTSLPPDKATIFVRGLEYDSRRVGPGFLFFAFAGAKADGRAYAAQALDRGAAAVVSDLPALEGLESVWLRVKHGRRALALMSRRFYGAPDEQLRLTGITGTNGKTTTAFLIDAMLRHTGAVTGMVGTVLYRIAGEERPAINTTPESLDLLRLMDQLRERQATHFTFEVSSHALDLRRVFGLTFHTAVFTNLSRDHLDYHGTMDAYFAAKAELFAGAGGPPPRYAVLNADDEWAGRIRTDATTARWTYGVRQNADFRAEKIDSGFHGMRFEVRHPTGRTAIASPLFGMINVYNLLAGFAAGRSLGLSPEEAAAGLAACRAVPGRFERVDRGQPFLVVVDYAHTDDALRNTLAVARSLRPRRVITLFGCGGDRDRAKRPLMGHAAAEGSDLVIVTSDNPRSEDPLAIINDALVGVRRSDTRTIVEPDRETAIRRAVEEAGKEDIVLLAGKGHETYQVLKDRTVPFDDRTVAGEALASLGYPGQGVGA